MFCTVHVASIGSDKVMSDELMSIKFVGLDIKLHEI